MKRLICILLFLFPVVVFAQNNQPALRSVTNIQNMAGFTSRTASAIHSKRNPGQSFKYQNPDQDSLIQIFDSIYDWYCNNDSLRWVFSDKKANMVYDAKNNLTTESFYSWADNSWVKQRQFFYTYDSTHKMTSSMDKFRSGSAWVNEFQYVYTYDTHNNKTKESDQDWNGIDSIWMDYGQTIYTYDANDNLINELQQMLSDTTWNNDIQYIYANDDNHRRTNELSQIWYGSFWFNLENDTLTYDINNNLTSILGKTWSSAGWSDFYQYLNFYTYDDNNFQKSYSRKIWNDTGTAIQGGDSTYYYFHTVLGINELKLQDVGITIYPNPAKDKCEVQCAECNIKSIEIFNLTGKKVYGAEFSSGTGDSVEVSFDLPAGIYFVKMMSERTVEIGKLIIN